MSFFAGIKQRILKGKSNRSNSERGAQHVNRKRTAKSQKLEEEEEMCTGTNTSKRSSPVPSPLQPSAGQTEKNTLKEKAYPQYRYTKTR